MKLSEKTLMPIGLVIIIGGGLFSVGYNYAQIDDNKEDIRDVKSDYRRIDRKLNAILIRMGVDPRHLPDNGR